MANYLMKKAGSKYLEGEMKKRGGYQFTAPERDDRGRKLSDKQKKTWEIEHYRDPRWAIPEHDLAILMAVKKGAKRLDAGARIGPLKFGEASIIGLLPVVGDFADVLLAYFRVYRKARKVSKGKDLTILKSKMKGIIVTMGIIGTIPIAGDLTNTIIKFNTQNAALLEKMLLERSGYFDILAKEKAALKAKKSSRHQRTETQPSDDSLVDAPPSYDSDSHHYNHQPAVNSNRAAVGRSQAPKNGGTWLGGLRNRAGADRSNAVNTDVAPQKPPRPEMATAPRHDRGHF